MTPPRRTKPSDRRNYRESLVITPYLPAALRLPNESGMLSDSQLTPPSQHEPPTHCTPRYARSSSLQQLPSTELSGLLAPSELLPLELFTPERPKQTNVTVIFRVFNVTNANLDIVVMMKLTTKNGYILPAVTTPTITVQLIVIITLLLTVTLLAS